MREIIAACRRACQAGEAGLMATLVRVQGSSYRRPGARLFVPGGGGEPVGMISGGCLESDLAERAQAVLEAGASSTVVYDMRSPDDIVWGLGLGCDGEVRVLLEPIDPDEPPAYLDFLEQRLEQRRTGVLVTAFASPGMPRVEPGDRWAYDECGRPVGPGVVESGALASRTRSEVASVLRRRRSDVFDCVLDTGTVSALAELVEPNVRLLVFGAGEDARPLVDLAVGLGWDVAVLDPRPGYARPERFPRARSVRCLALDGLPAGLPSIDARTPIVMMTHHFLHDVELLQHLLPSDTPYLGALGPRKRARNLVAELDRRGRSVAAERLDRLRGPIGLDIGSETPEEIALATLAEIQAVLRDAPGGFLQDRQGPLHEP